MNAGWSNLIPQEKKYTPALATKAASLLESGATLTAAARLLHISRSSLRNWAGTDPRLGRAFETFDQRKQEAAAERERIRQFKNLAAEIVEQARNGAADPVAEAVQKPVVQVESEPEPDTPETRRRRAERARERSLQRWWASDWTPHFEAAKARAEQEEIDRQRDVQGFWAG